MKDDMTDIAVDWVGQNHFCSVNTRLFFCSSNGYFSCFLLEHHIFHDDSGHHFSQCFFITSITLNTNYITNMLKTNCIIILDTYLFLV